jgi:hypothetical protein
MVKDTKKYTATGGWGFAHFQDGKPGDEAFMKTCFPATMRSKRATLSSPVTHNENHRSTIRSPACIGRPDADERYAFLSVERKMGLKRSSIQNHQLVGRESSAPRKV